MKDSEDGQSGVNQGTIGMLLAETSFFHQTIVISGLVALVFFFFHY